MRTTQPSRLKQALPVEIPRSVLLANEGIETSDRFARVMAAIMADVGSGKITPQVANAMTNAGGKLLKVNEMAMRWGTAVDGGRRRLGLTG